ncbi:MAG: AAA family ATPase [Anaerohalosphaera sp.]|nr:AAA family ATPase [Anaerohalosphaera sp.]
MNDIERLVKLINSGQPCISITTNEEQHALHIIRQAAISLDRDMVLWSVGYGVRDGVTSGMPAENGTDTADTGLCHFAMAGNRPICVTLDISAHLKNELTMRILRDTMGSIDSNNATLIMIDSTDRLPPVIQAYARPFDITYPSEQELEQLIISTLRKMHRKTPVETGITRRGMLTIIKNLRGLTRRQAKELIQETVADDNRFDDDHVNRIIAGKRRMIQSDGILEYVRTPLDTSEIGGLDNLKKWLRTRKNAFSQEAKEFGLKAPKGVLMLGVQGAGKSLCAKAIATAWQQPLLRLDPGALYDSYIGESEKNLRKAFKQAEFMSPVVLWIDEIEKAFASAACQSTDGGLSKRMFGSLLTWMQEHEEPVFVVATANDIEALPPELLRKGRFDEIFFVGLPEQKAREMIFSIHLKKRKRQPEDFELSVLGKDAEGFSGAEIEQVIESALHNAYANKEELTTETIRQAIKDTVPLSKTMAEKVEDLYEWAKDRCVIA